jgi:hypothetical protein
MMRPTGICRPALCSWRRDGVITADNPIALAGIGAACTSVETAMADDEMVTRTRRHHLNSEAGSLDVLC